MYSKHNVAVLVLSFLAIHGCMDGGMHVQFRQPVSYGRQKCCHCLPILLHEKQMQPSHNLSLSGSVTACSCEPFSNQTWYYIQGKRIA